MKAIYYFSLAILAALVYMIAYQNGYERGYAIAHCHEGLDAPCFKVINQFAISK